MKIFDTIQKLMAMADRGTLHEQEVATKKIQILLLKHNLSQAEVTDAIKEKTQVIGKSPVELTDTWKKNEGKWVLQLYNTMAKNNLCKVVVIGGLDCPNVVILGKTENIEVVKYLCEQLIVRIRLLEKTTWPLYHGLDKRGAFRRAFLLGAVAGIGYKLKAQKIEFAGDDRNIYALIIRNEAEVEDYFKQAFPRTSKMRASCISSRTGLAAGREAGENMSIRQGISGMKNTGGNYGGMLNGR